MRYKDRVDAQRGRNPCLTELSEYLARPANSKKCRLVALDFLRGMDLPRYNELSTSDLDTRLQLDSQNDKSQETDDRLLGQLLIIEDISPELIEDIGSRLDIDPWFFASFVDETWRSSRFATPKRCFLPSREKSRNFLPLYYRKCLLSARSQTVDS